MIKFCSFIIPSQKNVTLTHKNNLFAPVGYKNEQMEQKISSRLTTVTDTYLGLGYTDVVLEACIPDFLRQEYNTSPDM